MDTIYYTKEILELIEKIDTSKTESKLVDVLLEILIMHNINHASEKKF